jgi:hypothetical protein
MPERACRYLILVALLLATAGGAWAMRALQSSQVQKADARSHAFVTDIETWRRTRRERLVSTPYDWRVTADLASLPLEIGGWHGRDVPETDREVIDALHADAYLARIYEREEGRFVWLSLVASRQGTSFHLPHVCYRGWSTTIQSIAVPLKHGDLYAFSVVASQENKTHIVYYFYLWPSLEHEIEEGLVMFKVTAELQETEQATRDMIHSFIGLWFEAATTPA